MNVTPLTRNVTRVFREASLEQRAAGREWYERAHRLAVELAESLPADHAHAGDVDRAAAIIAVISPQTDWVRNVELAREVYRRAVAPMGWLQYTVADKLGCLGSNARKAARLINSNDPTDEIVSGPKVTAFWRTISDPTDPFAVVVDRHAVDVALGRVTDDETRNRVLAGKRYEQACDVYRRAAVILSRELGEPIGPAVVQATTWIVWRETKIRKKYAAQRERNV